MTNGLPDRSRIHKPFHVVLASVQLSSNTHTYSRHFFQRNLTPVPGTTPSQCHFHVSVLILYSLMSTGSPASLSGKWGQVTTFRLRSVRLSLTVLALPSYAR